MFNLKKYIMKTKITWEQITKEFKAADKKLVEKHQPRLTFAEWFEKHYEAVKK